MSIGLCCQYIEKNISKNNKITYKNICNEKSLQYNRYLNNLYSNEEIVNIWNNNLDNIFVIIKKIINEGYKSFRLSSNLFPLYDCAEKLLKDNNEILNKLSAIGNYIKQNNLRLTCHPDQFCVISSKSDDIIEKSIKILAHHAWVFDALKLDQSAFYAINIHGGAGNQIKTLINSIKKLPDNIKNRLTLENDELSYNVKDLYKVYQETGVPVVFDSHHHKFNSSSLEDEDAFSLALSSWGSIKPLTHLSNTEPELSNSNNFQKLRQHSQYVHYIPKYQLEANNNNKIDIDFEFKMKNLAIEKALIDFNIKK